MADGKEKQDDTQEALEIERAHGNRPVAGGGVSYVGTRTSTLDEAEAFRNEEVKKAVDDS